MHKLVAATRIKLRGFDYADKDWGQQKTVQAMVGGGAKTHRASAGHMSASVLMD